MRSKEHKLVRFVSVLTYFHGTINHNWASTCRIHYNYCKKWQSGNDIASGKTESLRRMHNDLSVLKVHTTSPRGNEQIGTNELHRGFQETLSASATLNKRLADRLALTGPRLLVFTFKKAYRALRCYFLGLAMARRS